MDNKNLTEEEITEKGNPKNPLGEYGSLMLRRMNRSHQPLTKFALGFLNFKADDVILDIGCGGGNTLKLIHEYNPKAKLYGVDHSITSVNETIKYNKELVEDKTLEVINSDVEKLPFDDNTFSKIVTVESFYFWPNQKENLKEVLRVLMPHGHLLVVNDIYDTGTLTEKELANVKKYNLKIRTESEYQELFLQAGFKDIRCHKMDGEDWMVIDGQKK